MEKPVFYIQRKKYTGESTVVSVRIPREMLREIDEAAHETGRTRNELLAAGIELSLKHMKIVSEE